MKRRELLIGLGGAGLTSACTPRWVKTNLDRQAYLDNLLLKHDYPHISEIRYTETIGNNPFLRNDFLREANRESPTFFSHLAGRIADYYSVSRQDYVDAKQRILEKYPTPESKETFFNTLADTYATVSLPMGVFHFDDFGAGQKTRLYVSQQPFEGMLIRGKNIKFSQKDFLTALTHEHQHAKNIAKGLILNEHIHKNNYYELRPFVLNFLLETEAYMTNTRNTMHRSLCEDYLENIKEFYDGTIPGVMNKREEDLVQYQLSRIKKALS